LVIAIGGKWTQTWQQAATGGMDGVWRTCLESMRRELGSRPQSMLTISLFHEANGSWYGWSVASGDLSNFKAAFARFRALQEQILPDARLMFALNADHVPAGGGYTVEQMLPAPSSYDVLGVDMYSMHHPVSPGEGISDYVARAAAVGKPLVIQEWGVKEDDTAFVEYVRAELVRHGGRGPGKIEMENYFNEWPDTYQLEPTTTSPNAAERYRQLW
jgi:beta-mannanase